MNFIVRNYSAADAFAVNRVALSAYAEYEAHFADWAAFARSVGAMSRFSETAEIIVAEADEVVGAVVYVGPEVEKAAVFGKAPAIRLLSVSPPFRGRGVDRALTQACIDRAVRDGSQCIGLHTTPVMATALSLYLATGFVKERNIDAIQGAPYAVYFKRWQSGTL